MVSTLVGAYRFASLSSRYPPKTSVWFITDAS